MANQPDQATCRELEVLAMELAIILTLLVVLAVAAVRWGADSRTERADLSPFGRAPHPLTRPRPTRRPTALARPAPAET